MDQKCFYEGCQELHCAFGFGPQIHFEVHVQGEICAIICCMTRPAQGACRFRYVSKPDMCTRNTNMVTGFKTQEGHYGWNWA